MRFFTLTLGIAMRHMVVLALGLTLTLTACRNNETHRTRLTNTEMDSYGKAIAGQYEGSYIILWSNSTMPWHETEDGRKTRENVRETVENVSITLTDNSMRSIAFHKFPIRLLSNIIEDDEALKEALAEVQDMDLTTHYGWTLHTDEVSPIWGMQKMMTPLTLTYGGQEHTIILKFKSDVRQILDKAKLEGSMCFSQVNTLQLSFDELHVDGKLVLADDSWEANGGDLLVVFRMKQ